MKKYLFIGVITVLTYCLTGCGGRSSEKPAATPTPEPVVTTAPDSVESAELVDMQVTARKEKETMDGEEVQYEAGPKDEGTELVQSVVIENLTGNEISELFLRVHPNEELDVEDEWGNDTIESSFIMANGEKMRCYYYKNGASTLYDIRIGYTDVNLSECFFRSLPLETITRISLRMEGSGQDSIPYAVYKTQGSSSEYSTLNDVKRRLGLLENDLDNVSDADDVMQSDSAPEPTPEPVEPEPSIEDTNTAEAVEETADGENANSPIVIDTGEIVGDSEAETATMKTARGYIGQSLEALQGAVGSANASDYEELPELGMTGYHYYGSFTVSTAVDSDGSEIVTGVW